MGGGGEVGGDNAASVNVSLENLEKIIYKKNKVPHPKIESNNLIWHILSFSIMN